MPRVLRARYVTRLMEHLMAFTEPSQKRKLTMPGCMLRQAEADPPVTAVIRGGGVSIVLRDSPCSRSGTDVPHVVPLGLGHVHQSHDSNKDSPAAKVLLRPSVMSRIDVVPPERHMIPVSVLYSP